MKERKNRHDENDAFDRKLDGIIIICIIALCLWALCQKSCAQTQPARLDTVLCKVECVQKIITSTTKSGNTTYKAVYVDSTLGIQDVIPMSKSVYQYTQDCKQYGIHPILGIKLKNGEINAIIRVKQKYRKRSK